MIQRLIPPNASGVLVFCLSQILPILLRILSILSSSLPMQILILPIPSSSRSKLDLSALRQRLAPPYLHNEERCQERLRIAGDALAFLQ